MSELLEIQHNVMVPTEWVNGRPNRYPFKELNVATGNPLRGDSFFVQRPKVEIERAWGSVNSCKRNIERKTGMKFILRRVEGGIRVWRIK